jgi:hypothetical protein
MSKKHRRKNESKLKELLAVVAIFIAIIYYMGT